MKQDQREIRREKWEQYRSSGYRRWRVYSTFGTGFLIGLFYVFLISENFSNNLENLALDQRMVILIFSGILGGVIYTILVDGHVEMPRFIANKGDQFSAGLFGDILLGIAGAVVVEFLTQQADFIPPANENIQVAALGILGGYGGRAILQFALNRIFKDINVLEEDRQKYLKASFQQRMEAQDSLNIIDQLNEQVQRGLSKSEVAELTVAIKEAPASVRKQVFGLVKDFRRTANLSGEKDRIERIIPIFEVLIDSEPENHQNYAQLAFAYKDSGSPDLFRAIQYLDKAIELRGERNRAETWKYELSRAITRIQQEYKNKGSYKFDTSVNDRVIADILAVAQIYNIESILEDARNKRIPVPVWEWVKHNQAMLTTREDTKELASKVNSLFSSKLDDQPVAAQPTTTPEKPALSQSAPSQPKLEKPIAPTEAIPQSAIDLIKEFEGYHKKLPDGRAEAYPDPGSADGLPITIGYGTTRYPDGRKIKLGETITRAEAEKYLMWEVEEQCKAALEIIPTWTQMNGNQRAALYSFAYNLGVNFYRGDRFDSITRVCDSPDKWNNKSWIEEQFIKYRNKGTSVEAGLRRRRVAEAKLFCTPVSSDKRLVAKPSKVRPLHEFLKTQKSIDIDFIADDLSLATHIQKILVWLDLLDPPADGKFGPISSAALSDFQNLMKTKIPSIIDEADILGPITVKALLETSPDQLPKPEFKLGQDLASHIISYMRDEGYRIFMKPKEYNIVYVEGMNPDGKLNNNTPNHFNDLRMVIEFQNGKPEIIDQWVATTEPGNYATRIKPVAKGAARIKFGQYRAWQVGTHKNHEALVQYGGEVTVHRDFNRDFKRTGDKLDTGYFGINQHWGYDAPTSDIKNASAGCLVGRTRKGHREFMKLIKGDKRYQKNSRYIFWTTIIPGDKLT